jgi:hypothetical protein
MGSREEKGGFPTLSAESAERMGQPGSESASQQVSDPTLAAIAPQGWGNTGQLAYERYSPCCTI